MGAPDRPAVLFDLDGTLTDPFAGITNSIRHALVRMGHAAPAAEDLKWCIGPPLVPSFKILLETDDDAAANNALRLYRERYSTVGKLENRAVDGISEMLHVLVVRGAFLSLATSKPKSYTGDILKHFDLRRHFDAVHGAELDGRNSEKSDLIRHILEQEGLDSPATVMIGDRSHDIVGAAANGMPAIGVLWGYGDRSELEAAGAAALAENPEQLPALVKWVLAAA